MASRPSGVSSVAATAQPVGRRLVAARAAADLVEPGPAQAAAGRQEREGFQKVGLARAVGADQHDRLAGRTRGGAGGSCGSRSGEAGARPSDVAGAAPDTGVGRAGEGADRPVPSYPHRHEHVERALVGTVAHQGGRAGIGHQEARLGALDLLGDVEQVARVEADLERPCPCSRPRSLRWRCRRRGWWPRA